MEGNVWTCRVAGLRVALRAGRSHHPGFWVAGRITSAATGASAANLPVIILSGSRIIAAGFTSEDGVFLHSFPQAAAPRLVISLESQCQALVVPLYRLMRASEPRFQASN